MGQPGPHGWSSETVTVSVKIDGNRVEVTMATATGVKVLVVDAKTGKITG